MLRRSITSGLAKVRSRWVRHVGPTLGYRVECNGVSIAYIPDHGPGCCPDDPDEYGLCEECGDPIAPRRLQLMPHATLCTECQGARDPQRGTTRKNGCGGEATSAPVPARAPAPAPAPAPAASPA